MQELQAAEQQQGEAATAMDLATAVVESQRAAAHDGPLDEDARTARTHSAAALAHAETQLRDAQNTHNQVCERQSRGAPAAAPFQARTVRFVQPAAALDEADGDRLDLEPWCPDSFAVSSRATRPGAPSFAVGRTVVQEATAVAPLMPWTNEHEAHPVDLTASNAVGNRANVDEAGHRLRASTGTQALTQAGFGAQTAERCACCTKARTEMRVGSFNGKLICCALLIYVDGRHFSACTLVPHPWSLLHRFDAARHMHDGPPRAPNPAAAEHPASNVATALAHARDPNAPAARKVRDANARRTSVAGGMAMRLAQLRRVTEHARWDGRGGGAAQRRSALGRGTLACTDAPAARNAAALLGKPEPQK